MACSFELHIGEKEFSGLFQEGEEGVIYRASIDTSSVGCEVALHLRVASESRTTSPHQHFPAITATAGAKAKRPRSGGYP